MNFDTAFITLNALHFRDFSENRDDFEKFLKSITKTPYYKKFSKDFKTNLRDYRLTKEHFEKLKNDFFKKFENCLDKDFLLSKEMKRFDNYFNPDYYKNGSLRSLHYEAFVSVMAGETILIEDFYLMKGICKTTYYPITVNVLERCWNEEKSCLGEAAIGCARALYFQFLNDMRMEINNEKLEEIDTSLPEYESQAQKIAWLHELGLLKTVLEKSHYNYYTAAKIVESFTDIKSETVRKNLEAIFKPNSKNKKNNPLNNPANILFVSQIKRKLKLD